MRALLQKYGALPPDTPPTVALEAAERRSIPQGRIFTYAPNVEGFQPRKTKSLVKDLQTFSESPLPARAINLICNAITSLEYGIQPKDVENEGDEALNEAADIVKMVLDSPNVRDDDFPTFIRQVVEDILIFDAGCYEYVEQPKFIDGNPYLALEIVPGYNIASNPRWNGDPKLNRWAQILDDGTIAKRFTNDQLEYTVYRKRSWSAFGLSRLEMVIGLMSAWLGLSGYQADVASAAYPAFALYLGGVSDQAFIDRFRIYFEQELKGRGRPAIWGNMDGGGDGKQKPETLQMKPISDDGLYLKYQEGLERRIAVCFDIKPQDFGIERDVNRNTSEVGESAKINEAIRPLARIIASKMTQRALPKIAKIANNPRILELEFFWTNINPQDEARQATIYSQYLDRDVLTIDEIRAELDFDPLPSGLGSLTLTAYKSLVGINPQLAMDKKIPGLLPEDLTQEDQPMAAQRLRLLG